MTVYISGPMKNKPDLNRAEFFKHEQIFRDQGHSPINPHRLTPERIETESDGDFYERCMAVDLAAIKKCEAIYLLDGWRDSNGAKRELQFARALGCCIMGAS